MSVHIFSRVINDCWQRLQLYFIQLWHRRRGEHPAVLYVTLSQALISVSFPLKTQF